MPELLIRLKNLFGIKEKWSEPCACTADKLEYYFFKNNQVILAKISILSSASIL